MATNGYKKIPNDDHTEKVSFVSVLLFQWMNSVFKTGSERALDEKDFLPLSDEDTTSSVTERLQTKWNDEITNSKGKEKKPKLWKSIFMMLSIKEVLIVVFTGLLYVIYCLLAPLFLGYLMTILISDEQQENNLLYGCALAVAMGINALVGCFAMHQFSYQCELQGIRISSAIKGLVYRKTLLLGKDVLSRFSTGRVIDLVSNDVQRMEEAPFWFCTIITSLPKTVVATFLLLYLIGWQALMGVTFLCFLAPYYALMSSFSAALRLRTAAESDQRISLMTEVVSGIRAIKTHGWEDQYREKIENTRRREINIIRTKSAILASLAALEYTSVSVATLVSIITLVLSGQPLTPVNAFMLLAFLDMLRIPICFHLAYGFLGIHDAYVSLDRIQDFLLSENLSTVPSIAEAKRLENTGETASKDTGTQGFLCVSHLTYKGLKRKDEFILQDIGLTTTSGSLTVVTGPVGSGKSTLLSAIAGEISDTSGIITCAETIVYVPQEAWVFSGTLRENILFGQPYDEHRYTRILKACALMEDIEQFPNGDQTIVGERGVVLSGGQRARVSLARAVYVDADLYLLDDPLSAVDVKVGQQIFEKCIKDLLGTKTRLLITHQEQHMTEADQVIVLCKGSVLGKGKFTELQEKGILNQAVDPLYQKVLNDNNPENSAVEENKGKDDRMVPLPSDAKGLEISVEDRTIGVVSAKLYWNYFRSGVPAFVIIALVCLCLITQVMMLAPNVWLSFLTKKRQTEQQDKTNLTIYGCLVGAAIVFAIIRAYAFLLVCVRCSERLHNKMVVALLQAPVLFFDSNPAGRILNRFSKDVGCMDELLPQRFLFSIQLVLLLFTSVIVPSVANPWLLFAIVPLTVLVLYISKYYLKTSRELKRLESISRSPVFSHISETLNGLDTIRTRRRQREFVDQFNRYQDIHNKSFIMVMASGRWLGVRMEVITSLLIGIVALAAVLASQDAAFVGLALAYAIQTAAVTQYAVRKSSDVENFMTSVERVMTYTKLDPEPGYKIVRRPPEDWPGDGNITFQDVSLTYYPGGPQVLKKINLNIKGGAKIGVAGRTGAGKSSFVAALLRMPDADGEIMVDGVKIKKINLQQARRCISVLGQSPVLFGGSLRKNLDLLERFQDVDLWRVLEDVQLTDLVVRLEGQLDHQLLEHGANVSVGERQLICLARVLLQQNKIIVLDEPTAHVDPQTEQTIWSVVREKLKNSTVITIAHRLNTIRDCDKILFFKEGEVAEFDSFDMLLRDASGPALLLDNNEQ